MKMHKHSKRAQPLSKNKCTSAKKKQPINRIQDSINGNEKIKSVQPQNNK